MLFLFSAPVAMDTHCVVTFQGRVMVVWSERWWRGLVQSSIYLSVPLTHTHIHTGIFWQPHIFQRKNPHPWALKRSKCLQKAVTREASLVVAVFMATKGQGYVRPGARILSPAKPRPPLQPQKQTIRQKVEKKRRSWRRRAGRLLTVSNCWGRPACLFLLADLWTWHMGAIYLEA